MRVKTLASFKFKLLKPCRIFYPIFKFKFKRPVFIKALQLRLRSNHKITKASKKSRFAALLGAFCCSKKTREMDRLEQLKSFSDVGCGDRRMFFPSPLTPTYVKASKADKSEASGLGDVEDACRSFENYLVEMIVEEGKLRDLMDVEELLYCWKNLKCPVFIDLVSRFYGELCKDLFSTEADVEIPKV